MKARPWHSQAFGWLVSAASLLSASAVAAQEETLAQQASPPERIDILVEPVTEEPQYYADCVDEQEAAAMFGEIVVCRARTGDQNRLYDKETAERRHAERTKGPMPVDVAGPGIFRGPATVSGLCFIPPCPKDPAYMVDFEKLPETPAGSDADRIGRGLAPRGDEGAAVPRENAIQSDAEELGLPPPPGSGAQEGEANPSGSASPGAEQTG